MGIKIFESSKGLRGDKISLAKSKQRVNQTKIFKRTLIDNIVVLMVHNRFTACKLTKRLQKQLCSCILYYIYVEIKIDYKP